MASAEAGTTDSRPARSPEERAGHLGDGQKPNRAQSKWRHAEHGEDSLLGLLRLKKERPQHRGTHRGKQQQMETETQSGEIHTGETNEDPQSKKRTLGFHGHIEHFTVKGFG
jgi:hypothetical protein